jgi:hypothetical protein
MPTWLDQVNQLRGLANLPPVTENPDYSQAASAMCQWECENFSAVDHLLDPKWNNDPHAPAARSSDLFGDPNAHAPEANIINGWAFSVFHGIGIIDPHLKTVGYGYYTTDGTTKGLKTVAALNIIQGIDWNTPVNYPIMWPADGKTIQVNSYQSEAPDARVFCQYTTAGPPIILQLGYGTQINSVQATLTWVDHGSTFAPCVIDATNYTNSDPNWQSTGQQILNARGAVALLPSVSLSNGQYTVDMVVNGQSYNWRFEVAAPTPPIDLNYEGPNSIIAGQTVQGQWSASGGAGPPYTFASQHPMPEGLTLSSTGTLSGQARALSPFGSLVWMGYITATDGAGSQENAYWQYSVNSANIVVSPSQFPDAVVGQPYSVPLIATGGFGPYTFPTLDIGAGLSLNAAGLISGTPTSGGFSLQLNGLIVTDAYGSGGQFGYNIRFLSSRSSIPARPAR